MTTLKKREAVFDQRLSAHYDELKWLYFEHYQNDSEAFGRFVDALRAFYAKRSDALCERDAAREIDPRWYGGMEVVGAFADAGRFVDGLRGFSFPATGERLCGLRRLDFPVTPLTKADEWAFDYRDPASLLDVTVRFLTICNNGVDVLRLTTNADGIGAFGSGEVLHPILRILRMATEIVCPGVLLMGDAAVGTSYFGTAEKPEFHFLFDDATTAAIWHTVATRDVRLLKHRLEGLCGLPRRGVLLHHLCSRDGILWDLDYGFLKQFSIEEGAHRQYLNDYFAGVWNGSTARGRFAADAALPGGGRIVGSTAALCGLSGEGETPDAERLYAMLHALLFTLSGIPVLDDQDTEDRMLSALLQLRASHRVFEREADVWLLETWNDHVLGIGRYCRGEKLLALFNFADNEEIAWIDEAEPYTDLLTDAFREAKAVGLPAHGFLWLTTTF